MHPLAWIAIRALVGRNIAQIDLDKGLWTAQSPALLAMGHDVGGDELPSGTGQSLGKD
jgi:hypothetical protein